MIRDVHETNCHIGETQMLNKITPVYKAKNLNENIKKFCGDCEICEKNKSRRRSKFGLMSHLDPAKYPFEIVSIDTIGGFGGSGSASKYLHLLIDHFTRYAYILTSKTQCAKDFKINARLKAYTRVQVVHTARTRDIRRYSFTLVQVVHQGARTCDVRRDKLTPDATSRDSGTTSMWSSQRLKTISPRCSHSRGSQERIDHSASAGTSRPECARENQWIQRPSRPQGQPRVDLDQEKISTSCGESGGPAFGHCVCESYAPTRLPGLRSLRLPSTGYSGTLGGRVECLLNHNKPVQDDPASKYNDLRELLRETIKNKKEQQSDDDSFTDAKENSSESDTSVEADNAKDEDNTDDVMSEARFEFQMDDDWELFEEKLGCYFLTKKISDDKIKVATLVTELSTDAHALLKQLVSPAKITAKEYKELVEVMEKQLKPKPSEAMQRCTFHTARQNGNEKIADFVARLKKLAINCNFEKLNDALRDQLVCGLSDTVIKVQLFEEKNLTLEKAVEIAIARESAVKNAASASNTLDGNNTKNNVHYTHSEGKQPWQKGRTVKRGKTSDAAKQQQHQRQQRQHHRSPSATASNSGKKCHCCGKTNHTSHECRFRDYVCRKCNKKGHLARACKTNATDNIKKIVSPSECEEVVSDYERNFFSITECQPSTHVLHTHASVADTGIKPMFLNINVNNVNINFEIDTGSFWTVISEQVYRTYLESNQMIKTSKQLQAYDGHIFLTLCARNTGFLNLKRQKTLISRQQGCTLARDSEDFKTQLEVARLELEKLYQYNGVPLEINTRWIQIILIKRILVVLIIRGWNVTTQIYVKFDEESDYRIIFRAKFFDFDAQ
ncbi:unnamed protein product [Trichogramma brassicae]|uniref:RNA-directed DNA polymerase n=1 Tax=Trichogramma brassicae TaxID=86971 RepID=A0A6H5HTQ9_9HYME|nr:unnamed protein product [Trichogramma brassicae]